jgi:hypothetical protein
MLYDDGEQVRVLVVERSVMDGVGENRIKTSADRRKVRHLLRRHKRLEPSEVVRRVTQRA